MAFPPAPGTSGTSPCSPRVSPRDPPARRRVGTGGALPPPLGAGLSPGGCALPKAAGAGVSEGRAFCSPCDRGCVAPSQERGCPVSPPGPGRAGEMDLAYVCEWEKKPKSNHCPSIPLVCAWSCRNLIAFTTDLRNEEEKGTAGPLGISPGSSRCSWETPGCEGPELCPAPDSSWLLLLLFLPPLSLWQCLTHVCSLGFGLFPVNQD